MLTDSGTLQIPGTFDDSLTFKETHGAGGYPHPSQTQHTAQRTRHVALHEE